MEVNLNKIRTFFCSSKKRKFLSFVIIFMFVYSIGFKIYNYEPVTDRTVMYGVECSVYNTVEADKGYNLFMLASLRVNPIRYIFAGQQLQEYARQVFSMVRDIHLVIMNMEGEVIVSRKMDYDGTAGSLIGGLSPVEVINETTIWVANNTGGYLWNLKTNVEKNMDIFGHHEVEYNSNNNTIFTYHQDYFDVDNVTYASDILVEYDLNGNVVWEANISDYISLDWICPMLNDEPPNPLDLTHSNAIDYDEDRDLIYCNVRNVDTLIAVDHKTKELIFSVGRNGQYKMFDLNGDEVPKLFSHSHGTKKVDENTFITFDNDQHNLEENYFGDLPLGNTLNTFVSRSRIVEFTINDETMTANETWVWEAPASAIQPMWGDVYRLFNGNRFGVFGAPSVFRWLGLITSKGPQLIELNSDGDIVWKATFRNVEGKLSGIYRCMRLDYENWKFLEGL